MWDWLTNKQTHKLFVSFATKLKRLNTKRKRHICGDGDETDQSPEAEARADGSTVRSTRPDHAYRIKGYIVAPTRLGLRCNAGRAYAFARSEMYVCQLASMKAVVVGLAQMGTQENAIRL